MTDPVRCRWCGKYRRKFSDWEQKGLTSGEWSRLCARCATKRLNNPYNALLGMRRVEALDGVVRT